MTDRSASLSPGRSVSGWYSLRPISSAAAAAAAISPSAEAGGVLPPPGTRIGQYEVIRELGRGGMGAVYLARDTKLGRRVAIKLLQNDHPDLTARFILEARATARCNHENIVVIHEVAEHSGHPFMVLEYLQGSSLGRLLDRPLSPQRAVELMVPVVRALACAHEHNIIHRDLKPDNIFVTDTGAVKVLDFGIAKLAQGAFVDSMSEVSSDSWPAIDFDGDPEAFHTPGIHGARDLHGAAGAVLTRRGALLGTLSYMSPEQWGADETDARSDIWAVGVILYRMVAGKHPLAPLQGRQLVVTANLSVPMPSVHVDRPDLPDELAAIIDRCLRKHKHERIGSARELLELLEPLLPGRHYAKQAYDSPYPGLSVFQESDAGRFFGRGREVAAALARLREQPLLGVVGPSGVGKSSFVRAGVLPAIKHSGDPWTGIIVRPGRHPLTALAHAVGPLLSPETPAADDAGEAATPARTAARLDALAARLATEPGYLGSALRTRAAQRGQRILLFVDQLEELYTLVPDARERLAFTACLASAADDAAAPVRVVVTIRADFLDRVAEDAYFMAELARSLFFLAPPSRASLCDALVEPAELAGYRFETPAMVDDMLDHLAETQGALPLLQFAASKLWVLRDRSRGLLTQSSYETIGGITGALASHADGVMAELPPSEQILVRTVILSLITPERTRAVVPLHELTQLGGAPGEIERLVAHLAQARLLVIQTGQVETADGATVEIVHESLIHTWPRLRRWLDENQDNATFLDELRSVAKQWHARGRPTGLLWTGETVEEARRWYRRYRGELSEQQRTYLTAVFAWTDRARRRRRLLFGGAFGAMVLLVAAAAVALVVIGDAERRAAEEAASARRAEATVRAQLVQIKEHQRKQAKAKADLKQTKDELEVNYRKLASVNAELGRKTEELTKSLRAVSIAKNLAETNETMARQAVEEAYLTIQRLQEQIDAMNKRIGELEALLETLIDDVQVE